MPRTKVFVWQMVSVIFAAICVFVLYNAILLPGKYQNAKLYLLDPLTNLALMLVAILTLLVCYHGLRKLTIRRILLTSILILAFLWQLYLIISFKGSQGIDDFDVRLQAAALAGGARTWPTYFSFAPNNVGVTLLYALVYRFSLLCGWGYSTVVLNAFTFILLDIGILCSWLIVRRHANPRVSSLFLLLTFFFVPLYTTCLVTYTDPIALSFLMMGFAAFDFFMSGQTHWIRGLALVLSVMMFAAAVYCKTNAIIALIALGIFIIFNKYPVKQTVILLLTMLVLLCGAVQLKTAGEHGTNFKIERAHNFPFVYWISAGLNPKFNGTIGDAWADTARFKTYEGRKEHAQELIKTRLQKMGPSGLLQLYGRKINVQWSLGTVGTENRGYGITNDTKDAYAYIFGEQRMPLFAFEQVVYITLWFFAFCVGIDSFKKARHGKFSIHYLLLLYIVGIFFFHTLMWEVAVRYSFITMLPLLILASQGIEVLAQSNLLRKAGRFKYPTVVLTLVGIFLSGSCVYNYSLTQKRVSEQRPIVSQQFFRLTWLQLKPGQSVSERVVAARSFNTLQTNFLPTVQSGLVVSLKGNGSLKVFQNSKNESVPVTGLKGKYRLILKNSTNHPLNIQYLRSRKLDILQPPIDGYQNRFLLFSLIRQQSKLLYPVPLYLLIYVGAILILGMDIWYLRDRGFARH